MRGATGSLLQLCAFWNAQLFVIGVQELAVSQLYSADGWASLYGGSSGGGKSSGDGWGDRSGSDDTGARNEGLHESDSDDDTDAIFGSSDDPDSSKNDVHWNAADSKSKTATSDDSDDSDDAEQSDSSQKKATSASVRRL